MYIHCFCKFLERFQSKAFRMLVGALVTCRIRLSEHQTPTDKEEIRHYSSQYSARLSVQPDDIVLNFMVQPDNRRLRRHLRNDLPTKSLSVIILFVI
jgi:hypothetical protein